MSRSASNSGQNPRGHFASGWGPYGVVAVTSAVFLGIVLFLHIWKGIPIGEFTRDPNSVAGVPYYTGFLSQIGIFFWAAAAGICLLCAAVLRRRQENPELARFLVASALLTLMLGFDDALLVHEKMLPSLGVPKDWIPVVYIGIALGYLFKFRRLILRTEYLLLASAFGFFGASFILDIYVAPTATSFLFEDGTKFVGIVSWLMYFFQVGKDSMSPDSDRGPGFADE